MRCLVLLLVALTACSRPRVQGIATIEDQDLPSANVIRAGDPNVDSQFASGFYSAEPAGWRWTRGHFSTLLLRPPDSATQGAELELLFDVPDAVLSRLGPVTLSATVAGIPLKPETRSHPGVEPYRREIPAEAFSKPEVMLEFSLDKVIAPNTLPGEDRELGIVVHAVALHTKKVPPKASAP